MHANHEHSTSILLLIHQNTQINPLESVHIHIHLCSRIHNNNQSISFVVEYEEFFSSFKCLILYSILCNNHGFDDTERMIAMTPQITIENNPKTRMRYDKHHDSWIECVNMKQTLVKIRFILIWIIQNHCFMLFIE